MMIVHEQTDERDLLIAADDASAVAGAAGAAASARGKDREKEPIHETNQFDAAPDGLLANLFSIMSSVSQRSPKNHNKRRDHSATMSNWLYKSSDTAQRRQDNQKTGEASYDILDATTATTLDEEDGFERVAAHSSSGGRKSPSYPFYNFHDAGHSLYRRSGRKCRMLFLISCLLILLSVFVVLLIQLVVLIQQQKPPPPRITQDKGQADNLDAAGLADRWLVSSPACHIPAIDPWHESIKGYVQRKHPLDCRRIFMDQANKTEPPLRSVPLTFTKDNRLHFTKAALKLGYLSQQRCCFVPLKRGYEDDDHLDSDEKCYLISQNKLIMAHDLIKIECFEHKIVNPMILNGTQTLFVKALQEPTNSTTTVYTNIHSFIVRNLEEEAALDRTAAKKLNAQDYYNIVMVGVDTISRLNGYRQLNQTLALLKQHYGALEFVGYNKVGENTFPNLIPFLTGLTPEQLTKIQCWQATNYSQESEQGDDYMDNCKYLWNFYQELGYITYFSEDWPKASTFNYLKEGFRREPTTFYGRPFTLARDKLLLPPVGMGCSSCLLDRPLVEVDLDNLKNFIRVNKQRPHFAFHWVNCPQHDDLNGASMVDAVFEQFFRELKAETHDDRTFVIFFSDHGYRWNNFVSTRVGHYESSLPLLTIAPPKSFIRKHPDLYENLKRHQTSLLTPFDMFKTLVAIRDLAAASPRAEPQVDVINRAAPLVMPPTTHNPLVFEDPQYTAGPTAATTIKQLKLLDGQSFRQSFRTISILEPHNATQLNRSCIAAGIPDNYCVCHAFEETRTEAADVLGAAYYLVYVHMYARLKDHKSQCSPLDLEKIHKAELFDFKQMKSNSAKQTRRRRDTNSTAMAAVVTTTPAPQTKDQVEEEVIDEQRFLPSREYNIRFSTKPGGGLFQEVVRYYGHEDMKKCESAVLKISSSNSGGVKSVDEMHAAVVRMNQVCKFSVHSDSISRLNLYKDQSKCVKSNIELKKICYCTDLL